MNILVTAAVPLVFQLIAGQVCAVNQIVTPTSNVCFSMTQDAIRPDKVDMQFLDNAAGKYMTTQWLDSSTMLSKVESVDGSCYQWLDDDVNETTTCEFTTNP